MNLKNKSIFNRIEIFKGKSASSANSLSTAKHSEENQLFDYYFDAEKPSSLVKQWV